MTKTKIEWTDYSSNPIYAVDPTTNKRGHACVKVSDGCKNCYAETINKRFGTGLDYSAQATRKVEFRLNDKELDKLLRIKKPCRVFIGDMTDIFQEGVPFKLLDRLFAVFALIPHVTYQLLTKRPERMREYLTEHSEGTYRKLTPPPWPLPNVWLGTSIEDQKAANKRIPELLVYPAVIRFLSIEPLLEPVDLTALPGSVDWVIIGGESGSGARRCGIAWVRDIIGQCKAAGVATFVKQLGSYPSDGLRRIWLTDPKGGDPSEWPEDLRVREFPTEASNGKA